MQQIWAPWRMELIAKGETPAGSGCIFCDLPSAPAAEGARLEVDRANLILGRTENTFAILNKYPYNNGHLMVMPRRHTGDLSALTAEENTELSEMLRVALGLLKQGYGSHGYNLGMNLGRIAGAGIDEHLHWHIVPRWNGDTNFMPVLGQAKVMIEHLYASWERLRPLFDAGYHWRGDNVTSWPAPTLSVPETKR
jgi:ATP adenylyltransferase